jgi:hypothetical protein
LYTSFSWESLKLSYFGLRRIFGVGDEEEEGVGAVGGSTLMLELALEDAYVDLLVPMLLTAPQLPWQTS